MTTNLLTSASSTRHHHTAARFGGGNVPEMLEWVVSWAWGAKGAAQEELGDHVLQHLDGLPNGY